MPNVANQTLNTFYKNVTFEVDNLFAEKKKTTHNLCKEEREAVNWLSQNENIVIKRADKGGAVVVWGRDQYIAEAMRQLNNCEYYELLAHNPLEQMILQLCEILNQAKEQDWISTNEFNFLMPQNPRIPSFYILPKIHKNLTNPPGRPIISGNESLTEPASKFIDFFLKTFVLNLPSFLQDRKSVV